MELDTGASVSLISELTYFKLWNSDSQPTLKPSKVRLKTYTGSVVEVVGVLNVVMLKLVTRVKTKWYNYMLQRGMDQVY